MAFEPDEPTSRRRREVGVFAREAWSALQEMLVRFRDVKQQRDSAALLETRRACDEAIVALERLQRALLLLSREMYDHRVSITQLDPTDPTSTSPRDSLH